MKASPRPAPRSAANYPTSNADTQVLGVNDSGQVWGLYQTPGGGGAQSYFTENAGVSTTIGHSGYSNIVVTGIDNAGDIVGSATIGGFREGFVDSNGSYQTVFNPAGQSTTIKSVSKSGIIAGIFFNSTTLHNLGFTDTAGVFTNFAAKNGGNVGDVSVNDSGTVVFQEGGTHGADEVLSNGVYSVLGAPILNQSINGTGPSAINDTGLIVGDYNTGSNSLAGFIAAPVSSAPEPETWALMLIGVVASGSMLRLRRRIAPAA